MNDNENCMFELHKLYDTDKRLIVLCMKTFLLIIVLTSVDQNVAYKPELIWERGSTLTLVLIIQTLNVMYSFFFFFFKFLQKNMSKRISRKV